MAVRSVHTGILVSTFAAAATAHAAGADGIAFFESRIRPVLASKCYACHSGAAKAANGGLFLDTRTGIQNGGTSGPAVIPGKPAESLLLAALRHEKRKMPPNEKLSPAIVADFEKWIAMGAPDPREPQASDWKPSAIDLEKGRQYWAFRPVSNPEAPTVRRKDWPRQPLDRFVLAGLEAKGLTPAPDAPREAWLRRVTFDLTGLPPTPEETAAFLRGRADGADARAVDRLLESPRYGERWGRHWLDIARYAESVGRGRNYSFPVAWRYRNYVIEAFNNDKPYDRFVREQIAGDLMPADSSRKKNEQLTATGFLALGSNDVAELNAALFRMDVVDEQINVTTRAFLALTVGCARCHDHKFDPIPTADYYALAGIFRSTEMLAGLVRRPKDGTSYFDIAKLARFSYGPDLAKPRHLESPEREKEWEDALAAHRRMLADSEQIVGAGAGLRRLIAGLAALKELDKFPLPPDLAMGVRELPVEDCPVHIGGDPKKPGPKVPRGFVQVLNKPGENVALPADASGRLQLADWLARRENPLTARVAVNRIWYQMFGRGIVATVDNFGAVGERPSHPELLDHLATRFADQGWSFKKILREIALSRTYRMSVAHNAANAAVDPDNVYLWRMNRRRLEAEAIRDAMLSVSGRIDFAPPAESPVLSIWRRYDVGGKHGMMPDDYATKLPYRSVYIPILRNFIPPMFEVFDFPEPSETKGSREVTTVPTQALLLMNSPFVMEQAAAAAARLAARDFSSQSERIDRVYRETLGRAADAGERKEATAFVAQEGGNWARLYQALFASAEFRYRD